LLLLPFVSPSRDGKSSYKMETPLHHRDESGGLFIGASILLFALMNSAPAELLHLLAYAALQPSLATPHCSRAAAIGQKNAGNNAGVGILFQKAQPIFQRKRRLTRQDQAQRRKQIRSIRSFTVH
jgi:hypothetical protein